MIKFLKILLSSSICFSLISCAVVVKESDIKDFDSSLKKAKDVVGSNIYKSVKIKNIALVSFSSNLFASESSSNTNLNGLDTSLLNVISDVSSKRGCIALDIVYKEALKDFENIGINVYDDKKLLESKYYMEMGQKAFPGLCTSGNTRINILFPPEKEMNKLMDELKVEGLASIYLESENDTSTQARMILWVKGKDKAEIAWMGYLWRSIFVETDKNFFFSDLQELSRSSSEKINITAKVYLSSFRLLLSRFKNEMLKE